MQKRDQLIQLYSEIPEKMITFDLTGRCNFECVMCVWHNGKKKGEPKEHLNFTHMRSVLNQAIMNGIKYSCINLSVSGEPFLNPDIDAIISYLFELNAEGKLFNVLSINTNMSALNKTRIDLIIGLLRKSKYGQLFLTCSLNSVTKETGIKVKGVDFFDRIEENMDYLLEKKSLHGLGSKLKLDLQMLILKENEHEGELFARKWALRFQHYNMKYNIVADRFVDDDNVINLKREFDRDRQAECDERFYRVTEQLGLTKKKIENFYEKPAENIGEPTAQVAVEKKETLRKPCHALWQTPIVRANGQVSVCLSDIDSHMKIGNLKDKDFLSIWLGKATNDYRIMHALGKAKDISICNHCTYYEAYEVEKKYWDRYVQIMEEDLAEAQVRKTKIEQFNKLPNKLLTIDISNACNLYCFYCTFTQQDLHASKKKKFLSAEALHKICQEFLDNGTKFECIVLSVSGEPTLNPQFSQIMQTLFEMNGSEHRLFKYISINTNVTFLDKTKVDLINFYLAKDYGSLQLTLSINSASKESFIKTKRVDMYDKTVENAVYLLKEKARLNLAWRLNVYLLFLVNEEVVQEARSFKEFWENTLKEIGLNYSVDYALPAASDTSIIFKRTYSNNELFKHNQQEYDEMHRQVVIELGLKPQDEKVDLIKNVPVFVPTKKKCASPWLSPIIRHDGTLNFCLQDTENIIPLGNLVEESFFDLWFSSTAREFRERLASNKFHDWDICKNCNYFDGADLPTAVLESYEHQLGLRF